jgi:hypothetical protein
MCLAPAVSVRERGVDAITRLDEKWFQVETN